MSAGVRGGPSALAPGARAPRARLALALGGGAARGLAHIGVIEVLEREGLAVDFIAGSSMGGLIGASSSTGLKAREIAEAARSFRFPRWFLPGGLMRWDSLFPSIARLLPGTFEELATPLAVTAVDLEEGTQVILHSGPLRPAVQATCAVPGVLPPVRLDGRWLVDGGVANVLPMDVAWMAEPDIVVAVRVGAPRSRRIPQLQWRLTSFLSRLGGIVPNPATAKVSFEIVTRAAEILLERQTALVAAMAGPEILIEPELGDMGLRDLNRLEEALRAGRRAAEAALPEILRLLESPPRRPRSGERSLSLYFDPVCAMVVNPARARANLTHDGVLYYFCSPNCLDCFAREPGRYLRVAGLAFAPKRTIPLGPRRSSAGTKEAAP
ncbi:MAG: patatin-like phospholipase family protein [Deltaproteobacteria bacterium]|nr:patatin-like phospholipase family protein [Deltaproteobacteria bacterium]